MCRVLWRLQFCASQGGIQIEGQMLWRVMCVVATVENASIHGGAALSDMQWPRRTGNALQRNPRWHITSKYLNDPWYPVEIIAD